MTGHDGAVESADPAQRQHPQRFRLRGALTPAALTAREPGLRAPGIDRGRTASGCAHRWYEKRLRRALHDLRMSRPQPANGQRKPASARVQPLFSAPLRSSALFGWL